MISLRNAYNILASQFYSSSKQKSLLNAVDTPWSTTESFVFYSPLDMLRIRGFTPKVKASANPVAVWMQRLLSFIC